MCGIIGVIGHTDGAAKRVAKHLPSLKHRGPDYQGMEEGKRFVFGHTLLSIICTTPVRQPIVASDKSWTLTYNGEIYNYVELLADDKELRARCTLSSDTQVLVEGLSLYGIDFVTRVNGMFAFAAFDHKTQTGYLVRDRLGVKPLYYISCEDAVFFASELKALLGLSGKPKELDPEGFYSYVRFRYPLGERTFFKGVKTLPPGSILKVNDQAPCLRRFWSVTPQPPFLGDYADALSVIRDLLEDAVHIQMRSDRSFCTYLSGGLDSSYLTAIARQNKECLDTYSIGLVEKEFDESRYSSEVSARLGTNHHTYCLGPKEYREETEELVKFLGTPAGVPNQVALKVLSRELSKTHRCVLSGEGADEIFGGYGRIFLLPGDWLKLQSAQAGKTGSDKSVLAKIEARYGRRKFVDYPDFFLERYSYVGHADVVVLLAPYFNKKEIMDASVSLEAEIRSLFSSWDADLFTKQLLLFQKIHLPGLLFRLDSATMAHSVEGRVPFLDHRLVEFMNSLPWEYKIRMKQGIDKSRVANLLSDEISEKYDIPKANLKDLAQGYVPNDIIWRKKVGFPIPPAYYAEVSSSNSKSPYFLWVQTNLRLCM